MRCGYRVVNVAVPTLHNGNGTGKKHTNVAFVQCATRALHGRPSTGPLNGDAHHRKQKTFPLAEKGQKGEMGKERKQKKNEVTQTTETTRGKFPSLQTAARFAFERSPHYSLHCPCH